MNRLFARVAVLFGMLIVACTGPGCGAAQPSHAGIYVSRIWTVPERVTTGANVELHMEEVFDLPPGITISPSSEPVQWTVSAGELFTWEPSGEYATDASLVDRRHLLAGDKVRWVAPDIPQNVQVSAEWYGRPLTVAIPVREPTTEDLLGGQSEPEYAILISDPEVHVNDVVKLTVDWRPRNAAGVKNPATGPSVYEWRVSAGELFELYPYSNQTGPQVLTGYPMYWRAPAKPQTAEVEFLFYSEPLSRVIEVLPAE